MIMNKKENINTYEYWEWYYRNQWLEHHGDLQTAFFANLIYDNLPQSIIDDLQNKKIADMSCAFGQLVDIFQKHFPNAIVEGIDFSDEALRQCKLRYPNYNFHKECNKTYDCIITSNTLEHCDYPLDVLKQYSNYSQMYMIVLVPYKGDILREHVATLDENSFSEKINDFEKIFEKIIDTTGTGFWNYFQYLIIYKRN